MQCKYAIMTSAISTIGMDILKLLRYNNLQNWVLVVLKKTYETDLASQMAKQLGQGIVLCVWEPCSLNQ